ncbi:MAG: GcrA cell cycle regulator [Alphaproteobacteria bacterium]|nr:GcrA cell cycle regulator [Alphaproteobacteria bacterium]
MSWTNERIDLLQKLWLEGCSASRIASELGSGITRNAVIGKVYRLGLSGRAKTPGEHMTEAFSNPSVSQKMSRRATSARSSSKAIIGNIALALEPLIFEPPQPQPVGEIVVPICEPVTILELRESTCRWPIGDPAQADFRFCGVKKVASQGPYCATHARIAYHNPHDRRRDRAVQTGSSSTVKA